MNEMDRKLRFIDIRQNKQQKIFTCKLLVNVVSKLGPTRRIAFTLQSLMKRVTKRNAQGVIEIPLITVTLPDTDIQRSTTATSKKIQSPFHPK